MKIETINEVIPKVLFRSSRPGLLEGSENVATVESWLNRVKDYNIKSIFSLLDEDELEIYNYLPSTYESFCRENGFDFFNLSLTDGMNSIETTKNSELIIDAFTQLNRPVLVHCNAGVERTGYALEVIQKFLAES
jgi:protein tyrosine/serine phosphatase